MRDNWFFFYVTYKTPTMYINDIEYVILMTSLYGMVTINISTQANKIIVQVVYSKAKYKIFSTWDVIYVF